MEETFDPSWWEPAFVSPEGSEVEDSGLLSLALRDLALAAELGSLRHRTLKALAEVSSAMLVPDDWCEPFAPFMQMAGRRSDLPSDLSPEQLALLAELAPHVDQPVLSARVADVAWFYGDRSRSDLLDMAIAAYCMIFPGSSAGRDAWRRALQLARRRGSKGKRQIEEMSTELGRYLAAATAADGFAVKNLSRLLWSTAKPDRSRAAEIARHMVGLAAEAVDLDLRLSRHLEREAIVWWQRAGEREQEHEGLGRVADRYVEDAARRRGANGLGAAAAGHFLERAIAVLRQIPRSVRVERGLDDRLSDLQTELREANTVSVELMAHIEFDPIDLSTSIAQVRKRVSGREKLEALAALGGIVPLTDVATSIDDVRERLSGSIAQMFARSTFSADGQKVAASPGGQADDDAIFSERVRDFAMRLQIVVRGCILPAHEAVVFEHRYREEDLAEICARSPIMPAAHVHLWAAGLWCGVKGEFAAAASLLVPQVEHLVRLHLKNGGAQTVHLDDETGVETEKGLKALLDLPEAVPVLGEDLAFELRALFVAPEGPNLRNRLAHGLLTDAEAWSAPTVYAWWLALRLVVSSFWKVHKSAQPL